MNKTLKNITAPFRYAADRLGHSYSKAVYNNQEVSRIVIPGILASTIAGGYFGSTIDTTPVVYEQDDTTINETYKSFLDEKLAIAAKTKQEVENLHRQAHITAYDDKEAAKEMNKKAKALEENLQENGEFLANSIYTSSDMSEAASPHYQEKIHSLGLSFDLLDLGNKNVDAKGLKECQSDHPAGHYSSTKSRTDSIEYCMRASSQEGASNEKTSNTLTLGLVGFMSSTLTAFLTLMLAGGLPYSSRLAQNKPKYKDYLAKDTPKN